MWVVLLPITSDLLLSTNHLYTLLIRFLVIVSLLCVPPIVQNNSFSKQCPIDHYCHNTCLVTAPFKIQRIIYNTFSTAASPGSGLQMTAISGQLHLETLMLVVCGKRTGLV